MKSKGGLGVLLLAALLSAIGIWLSNTAANILFLLNGGSIIRMAGGSTTHTSPLINIYETRTYQLRNSTETSGFMRVIAENTFMSSDVPSKSEEGSSNSALIIINNYYPATTESYDVLTPSLETIWTTISPAAEQITTTIDVSSDITETYDVLTQSLETGRTTLSSTAEDVSTTINVSYDITETYDALTLSLETGRTTLSPTAEEVTTTINVSYDIKADTASTLNSHHTREPPRESFTVRQSVSLDKTAAIMEKDNSVSALTDAEVLAIVIGAVFLSVVMSALLYQFVLFMKKKRVNRDCSVYIIGNELTKQDLEANGSQLTKL